MVAVLAVGFVANLLIRPVASKFHEDDRSDHHADEASEREAALQEEKELTPASTQARLIVSWGVVSLLLAYGVYQTVVTTLNLF